MDSCWWVKELITSAISSALLVGPGTPRGCQYKNISLVITWWWQVVFSWSVADAQSACDKARGQWVQSTHPAAWASKIAHAQVSSAQIKNIFPSVNIDGNIAMNLKTERSSRRKLWFGRGWRLIHFLSDGWPKDSAYFRQSKQSFHNSTNEKGGNDLLSG